MRKAEQTVSLCSLPDGARVSSLARLRQLPRSLPSPASPASLGSPGDADREPASASDYLRGAAGTRDVANEAVDNFADASTEELAHIRLALALSLADLGGAARR